MRIIKEVKNFDQERGSRLKNGVISIFPECTAAYMRADKLGISRSSYDRYEDGYAIGSECLVALAEIGIDVNFILTGKLCTPNAIRPELNQWQQKALEIKRRELREHLDAVAAIEKEIENIFLAHPEQLGEELASDTKREVRRRKQSAS